MELIEIKGLFEMDYGAPSPTIISNDNQLFLAFYTNREHDLQELQERSTSYDTGICALKFKRCLKYTFGSPGNETIHGHPYSKLGMQSCAFYELKNSNLIRELQEIAKIHPYYNPREWEYYRHFILTFHDNMFECIAQDFEIREENISLYNQSTNMLNELFVKHL